MKIIGKHSRQWSSSSSHWLQAAGWCEAQPVVGCTGSVASTAGNVVMPVVRLGRALLTCCLLPHCLPVLLGTMVASSELLHVGLHALCRWQWSAFNGMYGMACTGSKSTAAMVN